METINSKALVRGIFEGAELPRLPFVPWVFRHAARLEQVPLPRMYGDPTQYVKCLQNARKLYNYDAVAGGFDPTLEAELAGLPVRPGGEYDLPAVIAQPGYDLARLENVNLLGEGRAGRFGTVIESLRRIQAVSGSSLALAAVVSGPLALAGELTGRDIVAGLKDGQDDTIRTVEAAAGFLLKVVQTYCQLELDIIAFNEPTAAGLTAAVMPAVQSVLSPVLNTVRFYNASSLLLPGNASRDTLDGLLELGFDGIVSAGIGVIEWNQLRRGRPGVLGNAVPPEILAGEHSRLQDYLKETLPECAGTGVFLTTAGEVPPETPPENIHLIVDMISK